MYCMKRNPCSNWEHTTPLSPALKCSLDELANHGKEQPTGCEQGIAVMPKPGPGRISGNLEIWNLEIWKFWIQKNPNIKILKIKIHVAQNVGKVWISRKKSAWPHLGPFQANFPWTGNIKKIVRFWLFPLVGQWLPLFSSHIGCLHLATLVLCLHTHQEDTRKLIEGKNPF